MLALLEALLLGILPPGPPVSGPVYGDIGAFCRWTASGAARGNDAAARAVPAADMLADAGQGVRILYSSTSGFGARRRIAVSGDVFLRRVTPPRGGWPVIAGTHGTVGTADVCAPSWAGRSPCDIEYLNSWLAQGYAVVASDCEGLGTSGPHRIWGRNPRPVRCWMRCVRRGARSPASVPPP